MTEPHFPPPTDPPLAPSAPGGARASGRAPGLVGLAGTSADAGHQSRSAGREPTPPTGDCPGRSRSAGGGCAGHGHGRRRGLRGSPERRDPLGVRRATLAPTGGEPLEVSGLGNVPNEFLPAPPPVPTESAAPVIAPGQPDAVEQLAFAFVDPSRGTPARGDEARRRARPPDGGPLPRPSRDARPVSVGGVRTWLRDAAPRRTPNCSMASPRRVS